MTRLQLLRSRSHRRVLDITCFQRERDRLKNSETVSDRSLFVEVFMSRSAAPVRCARAQTDVVSAMVCCLSDELGSPLAWGDG